MTIKKPRRLSALFEYRPVEWIDEWHLHDPADSYIRPWPPRPRYRRWTEWEPAISCFKTSPLGPVGPEPTVFLARVDEGTRTLDIWNHNPVL